MSEVNIGDIVQAPYNSGTYIGKAIEDRRNFFLVEVLAVLEHPDQGDLHHPGQVDGIAFHERKALAFREKANVRKRQVKKHSGEVPDYNDSLKKAVDKMKSELSNEDTVFNRLSLEKLTDLEEHFYNKIFQ